MDLNPEAVQICQLSLWIKTAAHGKALTSLHHTIREGNSVVADPAVHPKAFDWQAAFPEVFATGGFDVVIGNPPYVRQELLTPYKPWLEKNYASYHGKADLYVYFYELGLRVLKPGGLMSYIVTNKWFEIQDSIDYWKQFEKPKLTYQEIQFHPSYALDTRGFFGNNKTFFVTCDDLYLLAVLNSPLMWWHNWRYLPHMKDEALSPMGRLMESLLIAEPTPAIREAAETAVRRLIQITASRQETHRVLHDWLRVEFAIEKPTNKLQNLTALDSDAFIAEVKHIRGRKLPLTAAALQTLRQEYTHTIEPARLLAAEALGLERTLTHLVNQAYALTPEENALLWSTAPPRMPISAPPKEPESA